MERTYKSSKRPKNALETTTKRKKVPKVDKSSGERFQSLLTKSSQYTYIAQDCMNSEARLHANAPIVEYQDLSHVLSLNSLRKIQNTVTLFIVKEQNNRPSTIETEVVYRDHRRCKLTNNKWSKLEEEKLPNIQKQSMLALTYRPRQAPVLIVDFEETLPILRKGARPSPAGFNLRA
ncbi:hypothetical protein M9H77_31001 [Catharanthus roseus]|uniref:Uncharacterized protein n=1 Tax=Catharanthus roseus TaxID=4058 RepID=A0ACB9ZZ73_CATRO|nr:hypothetical protein M9H77_31001 [Catharanthus roseus]